MNFQLHRKFTFEDPEDSYWNENGSSSSSFFDDVASRQETARAALDNLFEPVEPSSRQSTKISAGSSGAPAPPDFPLEVGCPSSPKRDHVTCTASLTTAPSSLNPPLQSLPTAFRKETFAVSIAPSECSASSLPSEAHQLDLDYSRLRAEHRKLQRHLENIRAERFRAPPVSETAQRLLRGETVSLDLYKSKKEKLDLLDAVIDCVDGNVILMVVLFIKRTLSDSLFREILLQKSEAAEEYISFLKENRDLDELTSTLFALGRCSDAAMQEFSSATRCKNVQQKVGLLKKVVASAFSDPTLLTERDHIVRYINLTDRQIQIEATDSQEKGGKFAEFVRKDSLLGQPALHTYYYSCLYHYDLPSSSLASPQAVRDITALTEKPAVWMAVCALVRQNRWPDVERTLCPRGFLGALSRAAVNAPVLRASVIPTHSLMRLLHQNHSQPPKDLLCRLLRTMSDTSERLRLAEKYMATEVVVECCVAARDRARLTAFATRLVPHSPDHYKVLAALNNAGTKWKN